MVLEVLSREIRSGCPEELFYADLVALVSSALESLERRLKIWKGASKLKGLRVNVRKTKMIINSENAGKVTVEGKFRCVVCRKGVGSNFIFCQFFRIWVQKRCSGIRFKRKKHDNYKWQACANQQTDVTVVCPGIELNDQSPETLQKFCYLGDTIGPRESAVDSIITRMRSG